MKSAFHVAALALAMVQLVAAPAAAQTAHDLLQQALVKEQAEGDLRGAIELYERIVAEFSAERPVAAKALVQMGLCYEKLGTGEAERAYRRVVQDFPDQRDMVEQARTRLTALARRQLPSATPGVVVRELVDEEGLADGGTPSPDGRFLAYTDWTTSDIAIRDVSTGESRRLTTSGRQLKPIQFGMDPAFSPDGRHVAFEWHDPGSQGYYDLRIVPIDGSEPPRVLYDTAGFYVMGPAWSNDGRHIAVVRYPDDESRADLLWVDVSDGATRLLDSHPVSGYQGLSHSPDDRYVVYRVRVEGEPEHVDVHIAATDGTGSRPLVQHPADDLLLGWVPGTDWVLFLSNRSNVWGAWAVRVVNGRAEGNPRLVHVGMGQAGPRGFTTAGDFH
jgi:tricorn protease-like protein